MDNAEIEALRTFLGKDGEQIFLKCAGCKNLEEINKIKERLDVGDKRFDDGHERMNSIELSLKENNKLTNDSSEILKSMHDKMFLDSADAQSIQSLMIIASQKLNTLWSIVIFLMISIAGIAFAVITGALTPEDPEHHDPIIYSIPSYPREKPYIETTKD